MNIKFAKENGIDVSKFIATYECRDIDNEVIAAGIDATGYALNGTSTFVVNGRFSTSLQRFLGADPACADRGPEEGDYARFFALLDRLIEEAKKDTTPPPTGAPSAPKP